MQHKSRNMQIPSDLCLSNVTFFHMSTKLLMNLLIKRSSSAHYSSVDMFFMKIKTVCVSSTFLLAVKSCRTNTFFVVCRRPEMQTGRILTTEVGGDKCLITFLPWGSSFCLDTSLLRLLPPCTPHSWFPGGENSPQLQRWAERGLKRPRKAAGFGGMLIKSQIH